MTICRWYRNQKKRNERPEAHHQYLKEISDRIRNNEIQVSKKLPNIIIFFMDDLGFGDISCYGAKNISTPNIDNLAENGLKFNSFYSSSPICSPSRAGILTGRHPLRMFIPNVFFPKRSLIRFGLKLVGMNTKYGVKGILADEITIPEVLKQVGYSTAMIGKWHLGDVSPHLPNDKGFDFFYGAHYSNDMKPYNIWKNKEIHQKAPADQNRLTKSLTHEAKEFIISNKDKPFFMHFCHPFPHNPLHASDEFIGSSKGGLYGDAVQEVDWSIGEIIRTLENLNLRNDTLILLTSDNGPWHEGSPGFHRGRKALPFEGGQRVPMIACWNDKIPAGRITDEMAMNTDFFPTILSLLNIPLPNDRIIDGKDIFPLMSGKSNESPHDYLYYHVGMKIKAVRDKEYKYHTAHESDNSYYKFVKIRPLLFDMVNYDQESYDQTTHHPEKAEVLKKKLDEYQFGLKKNPRGWT